METFMRDVTIPVINEYSSSIKEDGKRVFGIGDGAGLRTNHNIPWICVHVHKSTVVLGLFDSQGKLHPNIN